MMAQELVQGRDYLAPSGRRVRLIRCIRGEKGWAPALLMGYVSDDGAVKEGDDFRITLANAGILREITK